jgi:hypothetical protein
VVASADGIEQYALVTNSRFDHLLDPQTYRDDDERVRIAAATTVRKWISERIWNRLWNIGRAYELHRLSLLDGSSESVTLHPVQAANLLDEFEFVAALAHDDRALTAEVATLSPLIVVASRSTTAEALTIERPYARICRSVHVSFSAGEVLMVTRRGASRSRRIGQLLQL